MVEQPNVTIIVPTYNSEKTIDLCISSLVKLDYPKQCLDILIVDDGSIDGTTKKLKQYSEIKVIESPHAGPAATRNNGIQNATGDIIVFTDSDCEVKPDWIKKIIMDLDDADGVGGSIIAANLDSYTEKFEQNRRERLYGTIKRRINHLPSCNLAFRRQALESIGGFDEDFGRASAEDYDLCQRFTDSGSILVYDPLIPVIHHHSSTISGVLRRAYIHGMEMVKYRKKRGGNIIYEIIRSIGKIIYHRFILLFDIQ